MSRIKADPILVDSVARLLTDMSTPDVASKAEDGKRPAELWTALCESAIPWAWVPEERGGVGASVADGAAIIRLAGQHAAPVPICETLLAGWLLAESNVAVPLDSMSVAPIAGTIGTTLDRDNRVSGKAHRVPYASDVENIVVIAQGKDGLVIASVRRTDCLLSPGTNMAGEPLDDISIDNVAANSVAPITAIAADSFQWLSALVRSLQMAGALQRILELTVEYALNRKQFNRSIAKFQAIQHNIALLAQEVAAANCATDDALGKWIQLGGDNVATGLAAAAAKVRCGEAVTKGARIAHQVHGAMGYAREYELHHFTRRLWSWRDDFGTETYWATRIGRLVCNRGSAALWATVTGT